MPPLPALQTGLALLGGAAATVLEAVATVSNSLARAVYEIGSGANRG